MSKSVSPDASYLDTSKKSSYVKGGPSEMTRTATAVTDPGRPAALGDAPSRGGGGTTITDIQTRGGATATDTDMRMSNLNNTSFALPTQQHPSLSLVQTRSRKRNGARTLYIPLRDDGEEDASTISRGRANDSVAPDAKENGQLVVVGDREDMKLSALVENVSNTISNVPIQKLTKRPAVIAASIFLYLLLVNIFALSYGGQHSIALLEQESNRNAELFALSSSLCFQLQYFAEMSERIKEAMDQAPEVNLSTAADLKYAQSKVEDLKKLFNHSVIVFHDALGYKGKVEDLAFLIETHVLYNKRIKMAAEEEMQWLQSARLWQNGRQKFMEEHTRVIHFFEPNHATENTTDVEESDVISATKKEGKTSGDFYFNKGEEEENTFLRDVSVNRHKANALTFKELFRKFLDNKFAVFLVLGILLILFFRS